MKETSKKIYIAFAALLLVLPVALMPFFYHKNEADIEEMDKRYATRFEDIYSSANKASTFESWLSDHLAFRKSTISAFSHLNVAIGVSNNPEYVVLGKKGWMFLGNVHALKIDQYRRTIEYSESQIEEDIGRIDALKAHLNNQDIAFLFAVPPNKENIYPEYVPTWMTIDGYDKYAEMFSALGGEGLMYPLYPDIMTAKAEYGDILYPKTDAHWTALGAYVGYLSIIEKLNNENAFEYQTLSLDSYSVAPKDGYELVKAIGYSGNYNDFETPVVFSPETQADMTYMTDNTTWQGLRHFKNDAALNDARVLIIGDSFSGQLSPFFESSFSDFYFIHYAMVFGQSDAASTLDQIIEETQPDIIILEVIERHLSSSIGLMPTTYDSLD
ncbi:MAG: hypothetical protein AB1Z19_03675 [Eubacteriales bacterium]